MARAALIAAFLLDGRGGGRKLGWDEIARWQPEQGFLWLHLDHGDAHTREWVRGASGLDPVIAKALTAKATRPRTLRHGAGLLAILRAANLNPGADVEDMISLRCWVDTKRAITVRHRQSMAATDLRKSLQAGKGPTCAGDFLVRLAEALAGRLLPVFEQLERATERIEDAALDPDTPLSRGELGARRREVITLRRHMLPQRDALARLPTDQLPWLRPEDLAALREVSERMTRFVDDLDEARDRLLVVRDEIEVRANAQMNATMFRLSIITALFLPLGLLTGLLGINVGGMPGADNPWAFTWVCVLLLFVAAMQIAIFRRLKWI